MDIKEIEKHMDKVTAKLNCDLENRKKGDVVTGWMGRGDRKLLYIGHPQHPTDLIYKSNLTDIVKI